MEQPLDVSPDQPVPPCLTSLPPEILELVLLELAPKDLVSCLTVHSSVFHVGWRVLWSHLDLSGRTVKKLRLVENVLRAAVEAAAEQERKSSAQQLPPAPPEAELPVLPVTFPAPSYSFPQIPTSAPSEGRGRWHGIVKKKRAWHSNDSNEGASASTSFSPPPPPAASSSSAGNRNRRNQSRASASSTRPKLGHGQPYLPSAVKKITYRNGDFADLAPLLILCGPHLTSLDVRGCSFKTAVALSLFDLVNMDLKELDMSIDFVGPHAVVQDVETLLDPGHREVGTALARFRQLEKLGVGNRNLQKDEVEAIMELPHLKELELAEDRAWKIHETTRQACTVPTLSKLKFSSLDFEVPVTFGINLTSLELTTHVSVRSMPGNDMANALIGNAEGLANLRELRLQGPVARMSEMFLALAAMPALELFFFDYQAPSYPANVINELVSGVSHLVRKGIPSTPDQPSDSKSLLHLGLHFTLSDAKYAILTSGLGNEEGAPLPLKSLRLEPRRARLGKLTVRALLNLPPRTLENLVSITFASRKMRADSIARLLNHLPKWRHLRWLGVHPHVLPRARAELNRVDDKLRRGGGGWEIEMNPLRIVVEIKGRVGLDAVADWSKIGEVEEIPNEEDDADEQDDQ